MIKDKKEFNKKFIFYSLTLLITFRRYIFNPNWYKSISNIEVLTLGYFFLVILGITYGFSYILYLLWNGSDFLYMNYVKKENKFGIIIMEIFYGLSIALIMGFLEAFSPQRLFFNLETTALYGFPIPFIKLNNIQELSDIFVVWKGLLNGLIFGMIIHFKTLLDLRNHNNK